MAQPNYQWNPFQERVDCHVTGEVIKTAGDARVQYVPRAAPFFSARNFKLYRQGSTTPLTYGVDYVFGNPFDRFIVKYNRNVYGSIVFLKSISAVILADYDTIGGPFITDDVAYASLIANIANSERIADWSQVTGAPAGFPADPHEQPLAQTYDWLEHTQYLKNMVLAIVEANPTDMSAKKLIEEHMTKDLTEAHLASKDMLALELVDNKRSATLEDLAGNSDNATVSIYILKEALRRLANGTLNLN